MDISSLMNGTPIPEVDPDDVKRVWSLISPSSTAKSGTAPAGFSRALLAQQCHPDADVLAVYARATIINILVDQGALEEWREGSGLNDRVFQGAATFPLPDGLNGFVPEDFAAMLHDKTGLQ